MPVRCLCDRDIRNFSPTDLKPHLLFDLRFVTWEVKSGGKRCQGLRCVTVSISDSDPFSPHSFCGRGLICCALVLFVVCSCPCPVTLRQAVSMPGLLQQWAGCLVWEGEGTECDCVFRGPSGNDIGWGEDWWSVGTASAPCTGRNSQIRKYFFEFAY